MKISEIDIDRFRIWRSLLLRPAVDGLNVIYGPNEAGKTTVMEFVRAILYGFEPLQDEPAWHREETVVPWRGSLRCEHAGRTWRVSRRAAETTRGTVRITGAPEGIDRDAALNLLLSDTAEDVFSDVFALGVRELQQLASLSSDQVSEYIYGLSLGPQGRQLLTAMQDIEQRRDALLTDSGDAGRLAELFSAYGDLAGRDPQAGRARDRHARLTRQRAELMQRLEELQKRESDIEQELRSLRFLSACHPPWKQIQDCRKILQDLPDVRLSPEDGLKQLSDCERDMRRFGSDCERLTEQAQQLQAQAERLKIDERFEKQNYAIRSLVDQADWLRSVETRIRETEQRAADLRRALDRQLAEMGPSWTIDRLNEVDTSPASHHRLLQTARRYQDELRRRSRLRRWTRALERRSQQELLELNSDLEALGIEDIPAAIAREQERLTELQDFGRLRLQREQLALKIQTVRRVISRVDTGDGIPPWVDRAVTWITVAALALFFVGMFTFGIGASGTEAIGGALAAAAFGFAGMMWWGIRNGLRNHFDRTTGLRLDDLNEEARQADRRLQEVHDRIQRIQKDGIAGQHLLKADAGPSSAEQLVACIGECSRHISELERLLRRQERATARRRRLNTLRERFRSSRQALSERRREWCQVLSDLGMEETLRVQDAFDWWQRLQEVRELHTQWRNAAPEVEGLKRMFDGMARRVRELGQIVSPGGSLDLNRPLEVLTAWQQQLKSHERDRAERDRLLEEAAACRRQARLAEHQKEAAELRRDAVFARHGVESKEDLVQQREWVRQREEAESQLRQATEQLNEVAFSEPDLAIVEDDLERFDPRQGRDSIARLESELEQVEQDVNQAHETAGRLTEQIRALESGRSSRQRHFRRARLAWDIHRAAEQWYAVQFEEDAIRRMRERFEQENTSGALRLASSWLHRMTAGRYHRVWAPLGQSFLCIDDEYGRTFRVEQLSGGTREQLFLAIRFALARQFTDQGIELPLIMDDLFVNFDEERTEHAMDCLLELARTGQQILFFTCHRHLADRFRNRGVQTLWLPGHRIGIDLNRPEDEGAAYMEPAGSLSAQGNSPVPTGDSAGDAEMDQAS